MMDANAKSNLLKQLNKNPVEKQRFEKSLELAHSLGFVTPPNGR
jgi:pantoate kinase